MDSRFNSELAEIKSKVSDSGGWKYFAALVLGMAAAYFGAAGITVWTHGGRANRESPEFRPPYYAESPSVGDSKQDEARAAPVQNRTPEEREIARQLDGLRAQVAGLGDSVARLNQLASIVVGALIALVGGTATLFIKLVSDQAVSNRSIETSEKAQSKILERIEALETRSNANAAEVARTASANALDIARISADIRVLLARSG